jgi:hypothetical protein
MGRQSSCFSRLIGGRSWSGTPCTVSAETARSGVRDGRRVDPAARRLDLPPEHARLPRLISAAEPSQELRLQVRVPTLPRLPVPVLLLDPVWADPPVTLPLVPADPLMPPVVAELPDELCCTRRLFCKLCTPETRSAISSARRFASRLSTVPESVTSQFETWISISEASTNGSSVRRSQTSSRMRSSERV